MLKIIWGFVSLFLVVAIFLRAPQNKGLASFATKSNILGSPSSAERFLNNLTAFGILAYFVLAIQLNLSTLNL
jgi:protein translocase SecG subunit|uniref:Probable protein-export membrane protein SecG n=1 Tax=Attheya longicornis TaxID=451786 RepID=A0A2U9NPL7_9STRA|nr:preprotein translocase SecG subunit [Attheya longicornis]AWT39064.1 preprotein translocase SecG subunit [Attheya longicornis]